MRRVSLSLLLFTLACSSRTTAPTTEAAIPDTNLARFAVAGRPVIDPSSARFTREGNAVAVHLPDEPSLRVSLPESASGRVRVLEPGSRVAVSFALRGATPRSFEVRDGLAVYAKAYLGNDVIHRVALEGEEDFVLFERRPEVEALEYDLVLEHAPALRLSSDTLEVLDEQGTPRLRVPPPFVIDDQGVRTAARLSLEGCRYDADPRGPWGRPLTAPESSSCTLRVSWSGVRYPALVDPGWLRTGDAANARVLHTSTTLADGRILFAGGGTNITELYDPTTRTFATSGAGGTSMSAAERRAVRLEDGRVLLTGGSVSGAATNAVDVYNPTTGKVSAGVPLKKPRSSHVAVKLPSGTVLVAGGSDVSAEILDPTTLAPTLSKNKMANAHIGGVGVLLASGKVLLAGGSSTEGVTGVAVSNIAELYDPATDSFVKTGAMNNARASFAAVLLGSGKALVVGGFDDARKLSTAEIYDPDTGKFTLTGVMTFPRQEPGAVLVPATGKVLVAGGLYAFGPHSSAEVFDPTTSKFTAIPPMREPRRWPSLHVLPDGKVLAALGFVASTGSKTSELAPLGERGGACSVAEDCISGFCVDGVCCDSACTGTCTACSAAKKGSGADGVCEPVASGTDPKSSCAPDAGYPASCKGDGLCDGKGACRIFAPAGTPCGATATTCTGGSVSGAVCNGGGLCTTAVIACAPFVCGAVECKTSCTLDTDCVLDAFCNKSGVCQIKSRNGASCASGGECASGRCVDGFCCDSPCNGSCEACDVKGSEGTCTRVVGDTHGDRARCAGDGSACNGTCDGLARDCVFPDAKTTCGDGCANARLSACNGKGECATASCPDQFACASATACATTCTKDGDCATGYACASGRCLPPISKCSDDRKTSISADGRSTPCDAFLCDPATGSCLKQCAATADCAGGFVCDGNKCVPGASSEDSGGCAFGRRTMSGSVALLVLLAALRRRRR